MKSTPTEPEDDRKGEMNTIEGIQTTGRVSSSDTTEASDTTTVMTSEDDTESSDTEHRIFRNGTKHAPWEKKVEDIHSDVKS